MLTNEQVIPDAGATVMISSDVHIVSIHASIKLVDWKLKSSSALIPEYYLQAQACNKLYACNTYFEYVYREHDIYAVYLGMINIIYDKLFAVTRPVLLIAGKLCVTACDSCFVAHQSQELYSIVFEPREIKQQLHLHQAAAMFIDVRVILDKENAGC